MEGFFVLQTGGDGLARWVAVCIAIRRSSGRSEIRWKRVHKFEHTRRWRHLAMRLRVAGLPTLVPSYSGFSRISLCSLQRLSSCLTSPNHVYTMPNLHNLFKMMIVILINLFVNVNMCVLNGNICTATENVGRCADQPSWLNDLGNIFPLVSLSISDDF